MLVQNMLEASKDDDKFKDSMLQSLRRELEKVTRICLTYEEDHKKMMQNVKMSKYRECDEERVIYMNECFRLHRLLKNYGAKNNNAKEFKGIKVTQSTTGMSPSLRARRNLALHSQSSSPEPKRSLDKARASEDKNLAAANNEKLINMQKRTIASLEEDIRMMSRRNEQL